VISEEEEEEVGEAQEGEIDGAPFAEATS